MTAIRFVAMPTAEAEHYWRGGPDAYGQIPEKHLSDGSGVSCRHCQEDIAAGEAFLILAHRPFPVEQPYAETGPIFLHAAPCRRHAESGETPAMLLEREHHLIKGYGSDDRIVYGTGRIVESPRLAEAAAAILERDDIAYVHVRSALNNCFTCRIDRA